MEFVQFLTTHRSGIVRLAFVHGLSCRSEGDSSSGPINGRRPAPDLRCPGQGSGAAPPDGAFRPGRPSERALSPPAGEIGMERLMHDRYSITGSRQGPDRLRPDARTNRGAGAKR